MLQKNCFLNEYLIYISIFHLQTLEWSKQLYSTASSAVSYCKAKFQTFPKLFRTTTKFRKRIFLTFKPIFKKYIDKPSHVRMIKFFKNSFQNKKNTYISTYGEITVYVSIRIFSTNMPCFTIIFQIQHSTLDAYKTRNLIR